MSTKSVKSREYFSESSITSERSCSTNLKCSSSEMLQLLLGMLQAWPGILQLLPGMLQLPSGSRDFISWLQKIWGSLNLLSIKLHTQTWILFGFIFSKLVVISYGGFICFSVLCIVFRMCILSLKPDQSLPKTMVAGLPSVASRAFPCFRFHAGDSVTRLECQLPLM